MEHRRRQFATYHAFVAEARRERSSRWGKRRWAARYRSEHGEWPWERYQRGVMLMASSMAATKSSSSIGYRSTVSFGIRDVQRGP